jgi:hypothetical protein
MAGVSLVANPLIIFAGHENVISEIDTGDSVDRPDGLGHVSFSGLKLKAIGSIVATSGTDLGPAARYPGLARTDCHSGGKQATIGYAEEVDHAAVLPPCQGVHHTGLRPRHEIRPSSAETHESAKGGERMALKIAQLAKGIFSARTEAPLQ